MKKLLILLLLFSLELPSAHAQNAPADNKQSARFAPIVIKVMNRGTNILMSTSFLFVLLYSIYVAIGVSFGSMQATAFISIFWGTGIIFLGGAIAKIYYLFLT